MTRRHCVAIVCGSLVAALSAAAAGQAVQTATGTLKIGGDVTTPLTLTLDEFKTLPHIHIDMTENGATVRYDGVLVGELLKRAGAPSGSDLRGTALTSYVTASASDGYQVVFSVAELDPTLANSKIMVADAIDGKPLSATQGPLRVIVPGDSRPARSVRMLERLDVTRLKKEP